MEVCSYEQIARVHHSPPQRGFQNNYCSQVVIFHILSFRKVHVLLHNADGLWLLNFVLMQIKQLTFYIVRVYIYTHIIAALYRDESKGWETREG